ncbi:Kinesin-like protein KIF11, partial [Fragariocoptes setiger]
MSNNGSFGQHIQVYLRCRPPKPQEEWGPIDLDLDSNSVKVNEKLFKFNHVFPLNTPQIVVYNTIVKPLIDQVLMGFNCTVLAYGQTGTGKTYTMEGARSDEDLSWEHDPECGLIPRALNQLFETLKNDHDRYSIRVSFIELYNEDTYDLLSEADDTTKLKVFDDIQRKGSVIIGGLKEVVADSKAEIFDLLKRGSRKRQTAATLLNACSSRSHTIFTVTVLMKEGSINGEGILRIGKLNLVDLAGNENIARSGAQDKRAREVGTINQSLLTLGRVITALVEKRPHVPFRESKLTRILQDSLGGKTQTCIVATISPALNSLDDTLNTLEYACKVKKIVNQPDINERQTERQREQHFQELAELRAEIRAEIEIEVRNEVALEWKREADKRQENYSKSLEEFKQKMISHQEERIATISASYKEEIERNKEEIERTKEELERTKEELERTKDELERTKGQLELTREEFKQSNEELEQNKKVPERTNEDLEQTKEELGRTKEELERTKEELERLARECKIKDHRLQVKIDCHEKELAKKDEEIDVLTKHVHELEESQVTVISKVKLNTRPAADNGNSEYANVTFDDNAPQDDIAVVPNKRATKRKVIARPTGTGLSGKKKRITRNAREEEHSPIELSRPRTRSRVNRALF